MSKRELETLAQAAVDEGAPRTKRRKETPAEDVKPGPSKVGKTLEMDGSGKDETEEQRRARLEVVKQQASQLWQTIKDAQGPECVTVSQCTT